MNNNNNLKYIEINDNDNEYLLQLVVDIVIQQLPNMPIEYVDALICDQSLNFQTLILNDNNNKRDKHIGCVVYRLFKSCNFAEIAFCCILTKYQGKGYGSHLMNGFLSKLKQFKIRYAICYADNDAIGYFEKQGFEMGGIEKMKREIWYNQIYHYNGGQIMSIDTYNYNKLKRNKIRNNNFIYNNKIEFQSCVNTNSFQTEYNIRSPPKIITNLHCDEYRLLSPTSRMTPNANWRSTINTSSNYISKRNITQNIISKQVRRRKKKRTTLSPINEYLYSPKHKRLKLNNYKIIDINEYDPNRNHCHFTRFQQQQKSKQRKSNEPSLIIKLKFNNDNNNNNRYKLPLNIWHQITNCIERERLRNVDIDEICIAVNKIWKLKIKYIKSIIKKMDKNRINLYYPLNEILLKRNNCFILPFNDSESEWSVQIFQYISKDKYNNLWGYNLKQINSKTIKGEPNLFDSFYLSPNKSCIKLKDNDKMLIFTQMFQLKKSNKSLFYLPFNILQELYICDYPQFRYCFKANNAMFRKFIYSL